MRLGYRPSTDFVLDIFETLLLRMRPTFAPSPLSKSVLKVPYGWSGVAVGVITYFVGRAWGFVPDWE
jgi:hypothetical protein